jgi:hypothetical protein
MLSEQGMPGMPGESPGEEAFPESVPLKKFELLQKMIQMKNYLRDRGIFNDELELVIKFGADLSYETILALSNSIVDSISQTMSEKSNDREKSDG